MLIDWFTVGAQAVNFMVLVWLLHRFLYKPVLAAIDVRQKQIALAIAEAAAKSTAADAERKDLSSRNAALDAERAALLEQAAKAGNAERERLITQARAEADSLRAKQETALRSDHARLSLAITSRVEQEVLAIARKVLSDLSAVSLEERIGEVFVGRLRDMDATAKAPLEEALRKSPNAVVRSTFDMPDRQRAAIRSALDEVFFGSIQVRFETSTGGVCGVELTAGGQRIAWNVADYLAALDQRVAAVMPGIPAAAVPT